MFSIRAEVHDRREHHEVTLATNDRVHALAVAPRPDGRGSSLNGGELLFLALATCAVNDVHREAARLGLSVEDVHVEVSGTFAAAPGSVAEGMTYAVKVAGAASEEELLALVRHVDTVAEVHNTLRLGTTVTLAQVSAVDTRGRA